MFFGFDLCARYARRVKERSVKGAAFRQLLDTYEEARGRAFREDVLAKTPGPGGEALRTGSVIASGMAPLAWYRAMLGTAAELSGNGLVFSREMGRRSAERDIGTLHRMIFRVLSIDTMAQQIPRLIGLYFDGGKGVVESKTPGQLRIRFTELDGFDEHVWMDFLGGIEAMLAAAGAKGPRAKILSGGKADGAVVEVAFR